MYLFLSQYHATLLTITLEDSLNLVVTLPALLVFCLLEYS